MIKKHIELIKLYNLESTSYVESDVNKFERMILGILLFAGGILMEVLGINDSIWMYLYIILMWVNVIFTERAVSKPVRVLPLKDSFIVSNVLFVLPLGYGVVMGIAASVFYGFIGCLISSIVDGVAFGDIIKYGMHTFRDGYDPLKLLYVLGIAVGIWFLMSVQAFYRDRSRRIAGYIVIGVLCVFYVVVAAIIMRQMGVHGNYYLSEVFDMLPRIPCAVAALVFAVVSGIYSWKRCMLLCRGDSKGQEKMKSLGKNNEERLENWRVLNSDTGKKGRIWAAVGAVMVLVVMGMIAWFLSSGIGLDESDSVKGEIHAESHDPAEYTH